MATFNLALRIALLEQRMSQTDLAERIGINHSRMSNIVHGRQVARDTERKAIAKILKRPVASLFPNDNPGAERAPTNHNAQE